VTPKTFKARREVFEQPMAFFPSEAKEHQENPIFAFSLLFMLLVLF
jgi:hypothetical protein